MKALVLADLQWVDLDEWNRFLTIDQSNFDVVFLLGDINQILLEKIAHVFQQKRILGVQGDFGFVGDLEYYGMENCHGAVIEAYGMRVAGVEGANRYKAGPYPMHTQEEVLEVCRHLDVADILLSHNSPTGFHDKEGHPVYQGFKGLLHYLNEKKPKYLFHGHHHVTTIDYHDQTTLIGVFGGIIFDFCSNDKVIVLHQTK